MKKPGSIILKEDTKVENAFLVGIQTQQCPEGFCQELLDELAELVTTLGLAVLDSCIVKLRDQNPRFLIGEGKAREIIDNALAVGADVIIFDDSLSPTQQRNWEGLEEDIAVIDRQEVILEIFASHAHTSEARLQVALAQANYSLPRLKRRWTHLHRQRGMTGGMGMRGEGEQQLEVDSRIVRARIAKLKTQLAEVRKRRGVQRQQRLRKPVPVAAIVGYTNAGKSSLLNAMTSAGVLTANKLFATLDPTVRRYTLPGGLDILLADTVGFIRKLPHLLVEAFHSTLEETAIADYIVEVVDATSPSLEEHRRTTLEVLDEIGANTQSIITVLNKIDLVDEPIARQRLQRLFPDAIFVSAKTGEGIPELAAQLEAFCDANSLKRHLLIPHDRQDVIAKIRKTCTIDSEEYGDDGVHLIVRAPKAALSIIDDWSAS
ncbi:MAG TPA: GTPase HflX [Lentisphaeria bacterium]|nr:MAG: GTPase HflX [Lentisphaerae bacterium ADurb.Bin082]HQC51794.1 GTPase HflX [Lentisphaeria bacterium]HQL87811.1 GTPase HflX [Lentisphaeria bacterium]